MTKIIHSQTILPHWRITFRIQPAFSSDTGIDGILLKPKHSNSVLKAGKILKNKKELADGIITKHKHSLYLQTADCIPLIIYNMNTHEIGLLHIGFRNAGLKILKNLTNLLDDHPQVYSVLMGPHICKNCYLHEGLVRTLKWHYLKNKYPNSTYKNGSVKLFDIYQTTVDALTKIGIKNNNIQTLNICTHEDLNNSFHHNPKVKSRLTTIIEAL